MSYQKLSHDTYVEYINDNGKVISTSNNKTIEQDGFIFKDLEGDGVLYPFEDWRLENEDRTRDLISRLTMDEMIGLMAHTESQPVPAVAGQMLNVGTYNGEMYAENGKMLPSELTDQQKEMIENGVRHFCVSGMKDIKTGVEWSNNLQREAEARCHGIPVNISTDPRNGAGSSGVEFKNSSSFVSRWPEGWGLAAIRDVNKVREYASIVSREYRALGITTALGPQIDLGSEPRWFRISGTLGSDVEKNIELTRIICDGLQTTEESADGWGDESVIAMVKHWPGGGTGEGGRDAHYPFGKYAVYPGDNFETHMRPFIEGAFQLTGKTKKAAAVMPYYTVSWNQDKKNHENVGNSFSEYIIKDLLIEQNKYDGVICTDWDVLSDKRPHVGMYVMGGKCYGVEEVPKAERALRLIMNGVNQVGGLSDRKVLDAAVKLGIEKYGYDVISDRVTTSAYKIILNLFRLGLFDNPFRDYKESEKIVGCAEFMKAGFEAQKQSVVVLKDREVLPLRKQAKVYVPQNTIKSHYSFVRMKTQDQIVDPVDIESYQNYFVRTDDPNEADYAIVFMESPVGRNGYEFDMMKMRTKEPQPEAGYYPISLQYRPYEAKKARAVSIAGGDPNENTNNRSYAGKTEYTANESELDNVIAAREAMGNKPVIVVLNQNRPTIPAEFEPYADVIITDFGVDMQVIMEILFEDDNITGVLPCIMPRDMDTVETHCEDVVNDVEAYTDELGNVYRIGYGL